MSVAAAAAVVVEGVGGFFLVMVTISISNLKNTGDVQNSNCGI